MKVETRIAHKGKKERKITMEKEDYLKNIEIAKMNLKTKKRISTLNQYYKIEKKIKDGFKVIIFWTILMIVAGNSYLN